MITNFTPQDNTKASQQRALLQAIKQAPVSTIAAREALGIAHPAGRVLELRQQGYAITTSASTVYDLQGRPHRCAVYVLRGAA